MNQIPLNSETEALIEEVMWQMKGDMHNLVGEYNPAFTDKAEKHIKQLLLAVQQTHHHQLQKAREEEVRLLMTTLQNRANTIPPNLLLNEIVNYAHDRIKVLNHPELNQDPVHDFFTAPEEVKRPVYERALAKTQEEQEKKLDQPTVKCGHHQAMLERAAVGLDQDGKCIDCGAEVLRIDTNK